MVELHGGTQELLRDWHRRLRETQMSHYEAAKPLGRWNYYLGIPVVFLTACVGTSVFATLQAQVQTNARIAVGMVSVSAAVLAGLQTFLRFSERSEQHRSAAVRAGSIRREVEQLLALQDGAPVGKEVLDRLRAEMDELAARAPQYSDRIRQKALSMLQNKAKDSDLAA